MASSILYSKRWSRGKIILYHWFVIIFSHKIVIHIQTCPKYSRKSLRTATTVKYQTWLFPTYHFMSCYVCSVKNNISSFPYLAQLHHRTSDQLAPPQNTSISKITHPPQPLCTSVPGMRQSCLGSYQLVDRLAWWPKIFWLKQYEALGFGSINIKVWDVISHPWPDFNCCLVKRPLKVRYGWVILR